jgi:hypothetical protein
VPDAHPREAFSSEVSSGSREENASTKEKRFRAKWSSGSREENASTKEKRSLEMACLKNSLPKQRPSQPKENQ